MALGLDIPFIDPSSVRDVFNDALQCITLSCSPTNPNRFSTRNNELLNNSPSVHISTTIPDTPPLLQVQTPPDVTPQWSSDLETLHPLNISRTNFAQKQRQDMWLGPLFQYLIEEENVSVLTNLPKNVSSWVQTTAQNCKIIDGILMYRDKLMENPDHYRIFVPSDPHLQHHFYMPIMIVLWVCTEVVMPHTMLYLGTFIGEICQSMFVTGFVVASIVFDSNLCSQLMALCMLGFINTHFTHLVLTMLVNSLFHQMVIMDIDCSMSIFELFTCNSSSRQNSHYCSKCLVY